MKRIKPLLKRAAIGTIILSLLILGAGAAYQGLMEKRDLDRWPPLGKMYQVDGTMLHLHCVGAGSPTVVLEMGLGMSSQYWIEAQEKMSKKTRVCRYDRPGFGYSDSVHRPVPAKEVASRLHALLQQAGIKKKDLVLVGFSAGGLYVRELYRQHPETVAGMVLVDSTHEQQGTRLPKWPPPGWQLRYAHLLAPLGFFRLTENLEESYGWLPASQATKERLYTTGSRSHYLPAVLAETNAFLADVSHEAKPIQLDSLPVTVLSRGKPPWLPEGLPEHITLEYVKEERRVWDQLQAELVALSTRSRHVIATKSDHTIWMDEPELFVSTVLEMVELIRTQQSELPKAPQQ